LRILYVEDNDDLRYAIAELLRGADREVVECADGDEALELFRAARFDVVVTDVRLPRMSGTELARAILRERPRQWIVLCSGFDSEDWSEQIGENVRSLRKPFELDVMEALLTEIAHRAGGDVSGPSGGTDT
jgi:two-component system cell cycle response regulator CpdR